VNGAGAIWDLRDNDRSNDRSARSRVGSDKKLRARRDAGIIYGRNHVPSNCGKTLLDKGGLAVDSQVIEV
jgi:hypothetical protein